MSKVSNACPECGAKCSEKECYCGYQFNAKEAKLKTPRVPKPPREIKVFDGPGRGLKACSCGKYVGIRNEKCPACGGSNFIKAAKKEVSPKEIKTYDEYGHGRKQCAQCKKYIAGIYKKCRCGSEEFVTKKAATFDQGGNGRKQCPQCKVFVGRTVLVCPNCQHELPAVEVEAVKKDRYGSPVMVDVEASRSAGACQCGHRIIIAPAGESPKLNSTDPDVVCAWVDKTIAQGHELGLHYSPSALRYFVARQYDRTTIEYSEIIGHLTNCIKEQPDESDYEEDSEEELLDKQ